MIGQPPLPVDEEFAVQLQRTVDRVGTIAIARLESVDESGLTGAERVRALGQRMVEMTTVLTGATGAAGSPGAAGEELPVLRTHATADQLAVVGRELLRVARAVLASGDAAAAAEASRTLVEASQECRSIRRSL